MSEHSDELVLFQAEEPESTQPTVAPWRILIVDDEPSIHHATRFALQDCLVLQRPLVFISCYSAEQAQDLLAADHDFAVILLDVVMETPDAGLMLIPIIRETLNLQLPRIILRTGQPGYAPEIQVIQQYDINDYKSKSELTRAHLLTSITAAVRAFDQLQSIAAFKADLELTVQQRTASLMQAEKQLARVEKSAAIGRLVKGFAHELNTPLAAALSNLSVIEEYLAEQAPTDARADMQLALTDTGVCLQRMAWITKELQVFDLSQQELIGRSLLGQLTSYLQMSCEAQSILWQCESDVAPATWLGVNAGVLESIIDQLVDNAIKAMVATVIPSIQVRIHMHDAHRLQLQLQDNGVGMSSSVLAKAIDPFFTTRPVGSGQGLGLSVVANLVQGVGGSLELASQVGQGTTVLLTLPLAMDGRQQDQ